ncbi:MAG: hypothetical protein HKN32_03415 [Flavobacteriales bacterium]|nr:hypothetical protein [Flavobacteriales bacterium]
MRAVTQIPHPDIRIMIFTWNGKYLLEMEAGSFKQTFKIPEEAVNGVDDLKTIVDQEFIDEALERFRGMMASLRSKMTKLQNQ